MNSRLLKTCIILASILIMMVSADDSLSIGWINDSTCIGDPPWFEFLRLRMSARAVRVDDSISGDECPINCFWRNVDLTVNVAGIAADSVYWTQYLEFYAFQANDTDTIQVLVADTFRTPSQRNDINLIPSIIIRNLDANPNVFYYPGWSQYWDGHADTTWMEWSPYDTSEGSYPNIRIRTFLLDDVVSISLVEEFITASTTFSLPSQLTRSTEHGIIVIYPA